MQKESPGARKQVRRGFAGLALRRAASLASLSSLDLLVILPPACGRAAEETLSPTVLRSQCSTTAFKSLMMISPVS